MKHLKRKMHVVLACILIVVLCTSCGMSGKEVREKADAVTSSVEKITPADRPPVSSVELNGSDTADSYSYNTVGGMSGRIKSNYDRLQTTHGFDALTGEDERYFYKRLESDVYIVTDEPSESGEYLVEPIYLPGASLGEDKLRLVIEAFTNDHPEIFWLANLFGYTQSGGDQVVQMYSLLSSQDIEQYSQQIEQAVENIVSALPAGLNEYDRELYLHDALLKKCAYASDVKKIEQDWRPFTLYGALVENKAVCEGYTKAMQYLLSFAGIESIPVNGTANGDWHQWNLVKINGCWYHLDATWNDSDSYIFYDYFNITDFTLKYDHEKAKDFTELSYAEICGTAGAPAQMFNIGIPRCIETNDSFYRHAAVYLYGFDEKSTNIVETALLETVSGHKNEFYIQVSNSIDYQEAVDGLFYKEPYQFFQYLEDVNSLLGSTKIDENNVSIIKKERLRIVEIRLNYTS